MQRSPIKCCKCDKDAVVVERATFYFCADCWLRATLDQQDINRGTRKAKRILRNR